MLRRLERNAIVCCLAGAVLALILGAGRPDAAVAVLAGGALVGISYRAIKSSIDALASVAGSGASAAGSGPRRPSLAWPMITLGGRYALLGFLAYVMISRLRLHPIGLLAGASSLVAAAAIEAVRFATSSGTPRAPQAR
jgi:hypothetical protein